MICKYCRREDADIDTGYCSEECMARDLKERTRTCVKCSRTFVAPRSTPGRNDCPKCYYERHFKSQRKAARPKPGSNSISKILEEQQRLLKETEKRLSYGEIMAQRTMKNE